jgi:hypothetical protein
MTYQILHRQWLNLLLMRTFDSPRQHRRASPRKFRWSSSYLMRNCDDANLLDVLCTIIRRGNHDRFYGSVSICAESLAIVWIARICCPLELAEFHINSIFLIATSPSSYRIVFISMNQHQLACCVNREGEDSDKCKYFMLTYSSLQNSFWPSRLTGSQLFSDEIILLKVRVTFVSHNREHDEADGRNEPLSTAAMKRF